MSPRLLVSVLLAASANAEPRAWTLDAQAARVRFVLDAPWDSIRGVSSNLRGSVTLAEDSWRGAAGRIRVELSSFTTGLSLRDEDLRDQFFEVDLYPEATLSITGVESASTDALTVEMDAQGEAVGTLSLHGRTQPVRIPVFVRLFESSGGRSLHVRGKFEVPLALYGMRRPERLLMKLGDVAHVSLEATFRAQSPASLSREVAAVSPAPLSGDRSALARAARPETSVSVAFKRPKTSGAPSWEFAFTSPEGRGERLLQDPSVGGEENAMSCSSCHGWWDARSTPPGPPKASSSLWNSARRPSFWRGFVPDLEAAIDICVREFMLRPAGAARDQLADLAAYLRRISPDAAPPFDYSGIVVGRKTAIDRPIGGDADAGKYLVAQFCVQCHNPTSMRSPLTPGLYDPDYLVRRVRWIPGHDARQMPPMGVDVLGDTELRNIVTYLAGPQVDPIFKRKPAPRAAEARRPSN